MAWPVPSHSWTFQALLRRASSAIVKDIVFLVLAMFRTYVANFAGTSKAECAPEFGKTSVRPRGEGCLLQGAVLGSSLVYNLRYGTFATDSPDLTWQRDTVKSCRWASGPAAVRSKAKKIKAEDSAPLWLIEESPAC